MRLSIKTLTVLLLVWMPGVIFIVSGKKVSERQGERNRGVGGGGQGAAAAAGSLRVTGIISRPFGLWDLPPLKLCARAKPLGRNRNWLLVQNFQLQGKGIVRQLTFQKTAGMSEISMDTFVKCHHFCFSSTFSA